MAAKDETPTEAPPSTDVVVPEHGEVELTAAMEARMRELAGEVKGEIDIQTDIRLSALALLQKTSSDMGDARPGQIKHTLTGEVFTRVEVLLVKMNKTRTYWGRQEGMTNPPVCTSPNSLDGWGDPSEEELKRDSDDGEQAIPYGQRLAEKGPNGGGRCQACPKNGIGDNRCQLQYNYLVVPLTDPEGAPRDWENELPVGVMMKRTSIKKASQLNSLLLNMQYPWSNVIELSGSAEKNKAQQEYFVWDVKKGRPAAMAEMIRAATIAGMISDTIKAGGSVTVEGEEKPDTADSGIYEATGDDVPF